MKSALPPRRWTDDEDEALERLRDSGRTDREIAAVLGRTRAAVKGRRALIGLVDAARPRWTTAQDALLRKLFDQGLTNTEIAARMGLPRTKVTSRKSTLGLRRHRRLEPVRRRILEILRSEPSDRYLPAAEIVDRLYVSDPDGGPLFAETCLRVAVYDLRRRGVQIESRHARGYRIARSA